MSHPFKPVMDLFGVHRLTGGRCLVIGDEVGRMAVDLGDAGLQRAADHLVERAENYDDFRMRRRVQRGAKGGGRATEVDRILDNVLAMKHSHLVGLKTATAGQPLHAKVVEVLDRCFPEGLGAVVKIPYEDELIQVRRIAAYLRSLDEGTIEALGIRWHFSEIERLLPEYAEALAARQLVTAGDVAYAREGMHAALCRLVAYVVAMYFDDEAIELRDKLLAPIFEQQARLSALMRARRLGRSAATPAEESDSIDGLLGAEQADDAAFEAAERADDAVAEAAEAAGEGDVEDVTVESDSVDAGGADAGAPRLSPINLPVD